MFIALTSIETFNYMLGIIRIKKYKKQNSFQGILLQCYFGVKWEFLI